MIARIFSVGFSNVGFWVGYLTGKGLVNAGIPCLGGWKVNLRRSITNPYQMDYFSISSSPILALRDAEDGVQNMKFVSEAWDRARDNGAKLETHVYSGADHDWGSKDSSRWPYNEEVDKDTHVRTIAFFKCDGRKKE